MTAAEIFLVSALTFVMGVLIGFGVRGYLDGMERRGGPHSEPDSEPLWYCEFHNLAFFDDRTAREHAITAHGAPRDGEAWKATYTGGNL